MSELNQTDKEILEELRLAEEEGLRIKDLAESLNKSKGHISDQVSNLEDLELVEKRSSDQGKQLVFLGGEIRFLSSSDFHG
ncbi:winged helix-turn-helix transcriptional regulator [Haloarcula japonica]